LDSTNGTFTSADFAVLAVSKISNTTWLYNVEGAMAGVVSFGSRNNLLTAFVNSDNVTPWLIEVG